MNHETELKIQAWVDGALPPAEAAAVTDLVSADAEAKVLAQELRATREAVRSSEKVRPVPESREFYWSRIERAIAAAEASRPESPAPEPHGWLRFLLRFMVPAAFVVLLAFFVTVPAGRWRSGGGALLGETENALQDVTSFTFRSESERMTVVWLNTP